MGWRSVGALVGLLVCVTFGGMSSGEAAAGEGGAQAASPPGPLVVLVTDFGERGYLLGALKGSIYSAAPAARIDAISNTIERFDVQEAGYVLALAAGSFPPGTLFVSVVSPDRSGPRPPIILRSRSGHIFLSPDNGLLSQVALRYGIDAVIAVDPGLIPGAEAAPIAARDVFGPAAGAIARGIPLEQLGSAQEGIYLLSAPPAALADGHVVGAVTLVDRFGNASTNIQRAQLEALGLGPGDALRVRAGGAAFDAIWAGTYADVPLMAPVATLNDWDEVKLALNQGDLAQTHGITEGAPVHISPPTPAGEPPNSGLTGPQHRNRRK